MALLVPGSVAYVELVIALLRRGVFPVPMDPGLMPSEREALLVNVDPVSVVVEPGTARGPARRVRRAAAGPPLGRPIHLTSGTTGRPKGVFSGLLEAGEAEALVAEERDLRGFRAEDVNLVLSPLHHSAPLRFAVRHLLAGGRVVVPGPFDPTRVTEAIERERPTSMFCVQPTCRGCSRTGTPCTPRGPAPRPVLVPVGRPRRCPVPGVGQAPPRRGVPAGIDVGVLRVHGGAVHRVPQRGVARAPRHPGSRPARSGHLGGRRGHALVRGAGTRAVQHLGNPEKTAEAWRETPAGPAFTVGDLGRVDEDGYVYLDGRREDLVISGGVNVYPAEVERVLAELDGVEDVAVFGRDDDRWGQRVCAAVVGTVEEDASRRTRGSTWLRPSAPRSGTGSTRCRAPRPARCVVSICPSSWTVGRWASPEAELESFRDAGCPTCSAPDLRLLFVGINPGLWTAAVQTHFAHPGNRFYPALLQAGIVDRPIDAAAGHTADDRDLLRARGIGITNLVAGPRHAPTSRRRRAAAGRGTLAPAGRRHRPGWSPSSGSRLTARPSGAARPCVGRQPEELGGAQLWVVPNPSGLNAHDTIDTLGDLLRRAQPWRARDAFPDRIIHADGPAFRRACGRRRKGRGLLPHAAECALALNVGSDASTSPTCSSSDAHRL